MSILDFDLTELEDTPTPYSFTFTRGERQFTMVFFYRETALTMDAYPAFVALNDEVLARQQRRAALYQQQVLATQEALADGKPSPQVDTQGEPIISPEEVDAEIEYRRSEVVKAQADRIEIAAKKLLFLLHPKRGHNITRDGVQQPTDWETLAKALPVESLEIVTSALLDKMRDPFGLGASLLASRMMPTTATASSDAS